MTANIPEAIPEGMMLLCRSDGRLVTADRAAVLLLNSDQTPDGKTELEGASLAQFAIKMDCPELTAFYQCFVTGQQTAARVQAGCGENKRRFLLRRLNGFQSAPLFAIELLTETDEQSAMAEIGRATARLIHDFKNQIGGLKLYAAYLKKRFTANPDVAEGLEITDQIIRTLNGMSEHATLIGKLSCPVKLKLSETRFASLVEQAINQLQPQIEEGRLKLETDLAEEPPMQLDSQQMLLALNTLLARSVKASPENARLLLKLQSSASEMMFSIFDQGEQLTEQQRQSLFAFLTDQRLNRTSLNLALARRIVEAHGGQIAVLAAEPSGSEIRMTIGI